MENRTRQIRVVIFDDDERPGRAGGDGEARAEAARGRSENLRRAEQR